MREGEPELEELSVNPWSSPGWIRSMHLEDELSDFGCDRRSARRLRSALPAPVETEALKVPAEDGLRLDQIENLASPGSELGEPGPQESIGAAKLALEDEELMAKREHLGLERSPAAEQRSKRRKSGQKGRSHAGVRLAQTPGFLNDHGPDQILGRHNSWAYNFSGCGSAGLTCFHDTAQPHRNNHVRCHQASDHQQRSHH